MTNKSRLLFLITVLAAVFKLAGGAPVSAAGNVRPKGITVTPAYQQITIPAGAASQPISFSVTNNEPKNQTLELSAADFNTLNESGGLLFVGTNPSALQKKYGLAKWLSLPQKNITLEPNQTATINAAILNLPDMAGGGHYGALMLSIGGSSTNSQVSIHPIASSLLFVTKQGGDTHKLSLQAVTMNRRFLSVPSGVTLRFHNDGNTHLIPRGRVTVTNAQGQIIARGIINQDSGIILPSVFRQYYVPLHGSSPVRAPGAYKLHVDFRFDGISQFRSYQQSFYYVPWVLILPVVAIILVFAIWRYRLKMAGKKNNDKDK